MPGAHLASEGSAAARTRAPAGTRLSVPHALAGAFAAIALVVATGLALTHRLVAQIRTSAEEITLNTSPSVSLLSEMRGEVRQLQVATADHLRCRAGSCADGLDRITRLQDRLRAAWLRYRLLPLSPGESALWPRVEGALNRAGDGLALTLEASRAGRREDADARFDEQLAPAFDELDAGIARLKDHEHAAGTASAARIEALTELASAAFLALAALTAALTLLAASVAIRLVRRYDRTAREHADDLEQFAGRVAHDLRGPLASTSAALQSAGRLTSGAAHEAIDRGQRGLFRLRRLVDDLLDFARAGALDPRGAAADVRDVVDEVVGDLSEVAAEHRVDVQVETLARAHVACSRGVLTSVVQNLLKNAITHMGESETRVVRVRAAPAPGGRRVRIEVEDSGPGIPASLGEGIFEPFVRGPADGPTGSGIGLATVKRFVSAHGGRIGFRPTPRRGTLFWLEMPRHGGRGGGIAQGHPARGRGPIGSGQAASQPREARPHP